MNFENIVINMEPGDWIQIIGIAAAVYIATRVASRQNEKILTQNLEIKTYEELWLAIQEFNNSLVNFQAKARMGLSFLEMSINRPPLVGEKQYEADYRKRQEINKYLTEFDESANTIRENWGNIHQLWEQKDPIVTGLSTAFDAYKTEFEKLSSRLMFPQLSPWELDITNFASIKPQLDKQDEKTIEMSMDLLVYGIDMSRMIQKKLLSKYYKHEPAKRGLLAQSGYQLTETGLVPVSSIKQPSPEKPRV